MFLSVGYVKVIVANFSNPKARRLSVSNLVGFGIHMLSHMYYKFALYIMSKTHKLILQVICRRVTISKITKIGAQPLVHLSLIELFLILFSFRRSDSTCTSLRIDESTPRTGDTTRGTVV